MTKIYVCVIAALLLVIAIGGACWYAHDLRADLTAARSALAVADQSVGACATALNQANDATAAARSDAAAQRTKANGLVDQAGTQKGKNTAAGSLFATKITTSAKAPDCQSVLEAQLCPALSGY